MFDKVVKKIKDATLTIVGGGEEYEKLKSLTIELGIQEKVKITGMVSKNQVREYLLNSDIYVMTSITECFPMVLLEAAACGLPLVSFDVPVGPKAIIKENENGYLIKNRNQDEIAQKIVELLNNKKELSEFGEKSKEESFHYIPSEIMKRWDAIFEK